MTKSARKWLFLPVLLVTSMAAGMVLFKHNPSRTQALRVTWPSVSSVGFTRSHAVTATQPMEFPPLVIETGAVPFMLALPVDMTNGSSGFPVTSNGTGRVVDVGLRRSDARIARASTKGLVERPVRQLARAPLPESPPGVQSGAQLAGEVKAHRREVDGCASKDLVPGGSVRPPAGKMAMRWMVLGDGSLGDLVVLENTVDDARLAKCVFDRMKRWRFTPPVGGDVAVQSTFLFL
jgi:hypothetical protein